MRLCVLAILAYCLAACVGVPENIQPVSHFEIKPYLGKWYEIARLDNRFERGLSQVTAEYALREDGGVQVINRGFSAADNEWEPVEGKAYFVNGPQQGHLKVSFFGPFYASYVVFELGEEYDYAFVTGYNKSYLWLLARTPTVDQTLIDQFVTKAKALGFATEKLVFVDQPFVDQP